MCDNKSKIIPIFEKKHTEDVVIDVTDLEETWEDLSREIDRIVFRTCGVKEDYSEIDNV